MNRSLIFQIGKIFRLEVQYFRLEEFLLGVYENSLYIIQVIFQEKNGKLIRIKEFIKNRLCYIIYNFGVIKIKEKVREFIFVF